MENPVLRIEVSLTSLRMELSRLRRRPDLRSSIPSVQRFQSPYPYSNLFSRSLAVFSEW